MDNIEFLISKHENELKLMPFKSVVATKYICLIYDLSKIYHVLGKLICMNS